MKKPPAHPNSQSSDSKPRETCSTPPTTNITVSSSRSDHIVRDREIHKNILLEQFLTDAHNNFLNSHSPFAPRSSDTRDENDAKEEAAHSDTDSEATEEDDMEELLRKAYNNRGFSKKKKNVPTQGDSRNAPHICFYFFIYLFFLFFNVW